MNSVADMDDAHVWHPYAPIRCEQPYRCFVSRRGAIVIDRQGSEYIDLVTGALCAPDGKLASSIRAAILRQLEILPKSYLSNGTHEPAARLAGGLAELAGAPLTRVFFASSGSEANEAAMKIARGYFACLGSPRPAFAALEGGWHGASLGALGVSAIEEDQLGFAPFAGDVVQLTPAVREADVSDRLVDAEDRLVKFGTERIAGIFVEPIMSAAGLIPLPGAFLRGLRALCDRYEILLIFDEIISGCGRVGEFLAFRFSGITPDLCTLGKNLSADMVPISTVLSTERVYQAFRSDPSGGFRHGHNYSGYPAGCAAANVVVDALLHGDILDQACRTSRRLRGALDALVAEGLANAIGGRGLLISVNLDTIKFDWSKFATTAASHGILVRSHRDRLHLLPACDLTEAEVECTVRRLRNALLDFAGRLK